MPNENESEPDPMTSMVEGVDYIVESSRWVFTRVGLLKRGYCCGSVCRNCPYDNDVRAAHRPDSAESEP